MGDFKYPGQLEISEILITTASGKVVNITPQVAQLDIYESIFNNTISGSLTIADAGSVSSILPIAGYEKISFTLKTPHTTEKQLDLFVYKQSNRQRMNNAEVYTLQLVSYEFVLDQVTSKSRAYSGKHSDIVKQIFKENFSGRNKTISVTESTSSGSFINPYWSPLQAINWIANRTIPNHPSGIPSYFFFETIDGYMFRSLESAFKEDSRFEYVKRPTNVTTPDKNLLNKMKTIVDYKIKEFGSSMELISNGAFGNRIITKDLTSNDYTISTYDYSAFDKFNKLNENKIKPSTDSFGNTLTDPNSTKFIACTDTSTFESWVLQRKAFIEILSATNVEILVPGNTDITAGVCIDLALPASHSNKAMDKMTSGKYIVLSVRHIINNGAKHMMVLQLSKDSYVSDAHLQKMIGSK